MTIQREQNEQRTFLYWFSVCLSVTRFQKIRRTHLLFRVWLCIICGQIEPSMGAVLSKSSQFDLQCYENVHRHDHAMKSTTAAREIGITIHYFKVKWLSIHSIVADCFLHLIVCNILPWIMPECLGTLKCAFFKKELWLSLLIMTWSVHDGPISVIERDDVWMISITTL